MTVIHKTTIIHISLVLGFIKYQNKKRIVLHINSLQLFGPIPIGMKTKSR